MKKHEKAWEQRALREYIREGQISPESRDLLEGTQSFLSWTEGVSGGYFVPQEMWEQLLLGMAQYDNLFSEEDVTLIKLPTMKMLPLKISGWDLSTISSSQVGEGGEDVLVAPPVDATISNPYMHRASLYSSFEFEDDAFLNVMDLMIQAFSIALARGMGKQLVNGSGSGQPQGILTGAADSGYTTAAAGVIALDDFTSIYFALNRAYRASPRCRWVMSDETYQSIRKATDSNGRPLISIAQDVESIFGKRILISPSMPSVAGSKGIVFGDLSHFIVHTSPFAIERSTDHMGAAEYGRALYHGRQRINSTVFDPTAGATPPIVYATLHS